MRKYPFATLGLCAFGLSAFVACESNDVPFDSVDTLSARASLDQKTNQRDAAAGQAGSANGAGGARSGLPASVAMTATGSLLCGNHVCQCDNGLDDDGDGTVDGFDVECTGGIDDEEASFATGIPGDNRDPKWQDCFFDGNSGAGDDRCRYPTGCLTGELSQDDAACAVTETCRNNCQARTPNGCDCFGCCSVQLPGRGQVDILLNDSCSLERIGDVNACPPCTKSTACGNECSECELCPGKTPDDLPAHCQSDPPAAPPSAAPPASETPAHPPAIPALPASSCEGMTACDVDHPCLAMTEFCSLGCCLKVTLH